MLLYQDSVCLRMIRATLFLLAIEMVNRFPVLLMEKSQRKAYSSGKIISA
jgi:hypothetical protein